MPPWCNETAYPVEIVTWRGIEYSRLDAATELFHKVKFIYSEKATKFCEISTLLFSYVVPVKSKVEISQNVVAFAEYMNFKSRLT